MAIPQTPSPTGGWQAAGHLSNHSGFPGDPQIAVSTTHVVVTARAVIAFYDRSGSPLRKPISTGDFFQSLDLAGQFGIDTYDDTRTIFDPYRKRFWICALTWNSAHLNDLSRRDIVVLGVSISENPLDGWHLYYWDAVAHFGVPGDTVYQAGDCADYPTLGIDRTCIYQTNAVKNAKTNIYRYTRVILYDATKLANGSSSAKGWEFWDLTNPDKTTANGFQPAVHHDPDTRAYLVSQFGNDQLLVWRLSNPLQTNQKMERAAVTLSKFTFPPDAPQMGSTRLIKMSNLANCPLKLVYRSGQLYVVMNDAQDWFGDSKPLNSIRLVRLNVKEFPRISTDPGAGCINRIFGGNNPIEDSRETRLSYGWPAVEVNKNGDMAIVYTRTGTVRFPEMRYSAYFAAEPDIRPSRLLKIGEAPYDQGSSDSVFVWGDLAGASVDPVDDTAIWVAHQYASAPKSGVRMNFEIWVGKVFA